MWGKLKSNPDNVSQLVRTTKVQPVPQTSQDTNVLPAHFAKKANPQANADAKKNLRGYALQVYDRLLEKRTTGGDGGRVQAVTRELFGTERRPRVLEYAQFYMKKPVDSILPMLVLYPEYVQIDPSKDGGPEKQGEGTFLTLLDNTDDHTGLSRAPPQREATPAEQEVLAGSSRDPVMTDAAERRRRRNSRPR